MDERSYYESLEDYEQIKEYLTFDAEDFEVPIELPPFRPDYSKAIVVDNLPLVGPEKIEKLTQVVIKIYRQFSDTLDTGDLFMPINPETNTTYGFCFIRFSKAEEAVKAVQLTQGFAISRTNLFKVSLYSDLEKYLFYNEEYVPLPRPPLKPRPDVVSWLSDHHCRDQFVTHYGLETEICWANQNGEEPTKIYGGEREKETAKVWVEGDKSVAWSPQGSYLATFHKLGVKLWGSDDFQPMDIRFVQTDVTSISFSPCESYCITEANPSPSRPDEECLLVWDVRSAAKIRGFTYKNNLEPKYQVMATIVEEKRVQSEDKIKRVERVIRGRVVSYEAGAKKFKIAEGSIVHEVAADKVVAMQDPNALKWSHDGKYLGRVGIDAISVYELPTMNLLGKKSIVAKDIQDFVWSPRGNIISYWAPAVGNLPSVVNLVELPSREVLSSRKHHDVTDGKMIWQNDGDYLCVHMTKTQGKKKSYVLMFFRVRETGIPVEQLEISEPILNFAWEPSGDRFCLLSGEARAPLVSFYSMSGSASKTKGAKNEYSLLFTLKDVVCSEILWSPAGDVASLVHYAQDHCVFHLHDVENNVVLSNRRHDRGNKVVWDPSGRIITSIALNSLKADRVVRGGAEGGFVMYSFQGNLMCQVRKERLSQLLWRPRPKDIFTPEQKKKIIKNLRKYEKDFEKEDKIRRHAVYQELQAKRRAIAADFYAVVNRNQERIASLRAKRIAARGGFDAADDRNYTFETLVVE